MAETDVSHDVLQHVRGGVTKCNLNDILRCSQFREEDFPTILARSPYYDNEGFESVLMQNINTFSILSLNVQSINAKFDDLSSLVSLLADSILVQSVFRRLGFPRTLIQPRSSFRVIISYLEVKAAVPMVA